MRGTSNYNYPSNIAEHLAHCRNCIEPMYCIYDQRIRDYCHICQLVLRTKPEDNLRFQPFYIVPYD